MSAPDTRLVPFDADSMQKAIMHVRRVNPRLALEMQAAWDAAPADPAEAVHAAIWHRAGELHEQVENEYVTDMTDHRVGGFGVRVGPRNRGREDAMTDETIRGYTPDEAEAVRIKRATDAVCAFDPDAEAYRARTEVWVGVALRFDWNWDAERDLPVDGSARETNEKPA